MQRETWSATEKRIARRVFEEASERELAEILADFKDRASRITTPEEMWALGPLLERTAAQFADKYDYRYSQLIRVFGQLMREARVAPSALEGLAPDKLDAIRRMASL